MVRVDPFADAREVLEVSVGHTVVEPVMYGLDFGIHLFKEPEALIRDRVDRHATIFRALGASNNSSIDELVDQARYVWGGIQHALHDLAPGMSVRVDPTQNAKDIVMAELEIVLSTHLLNLSPHTSRRNEQVQHCLVGLVLKRNRLLDVLSQNLPHPSIALATSDVCCDT